MISSRGGAGCCDDFCTFSLTREEDAVGCRGCTVVVLDVDGGASRCSEVEERSAVVRLRFWGGPVAAGVDPSALRFLHDRWRVPGILSGPLRFGTKS